MLSIRDARLDVFKPGNDSRTDPDFTVPQEDIVTVDVTEKLTDAKDSGDITINNDDGQYSATTEITTGDRLIFWVEFGTTIDAWGDHAWGDGPWGGGFRARWTALVRDREFKRESDAVSDLVLTCEDFVFGVLGFRNVYNVFEETRIDTILDTVLPREAPEITRSDVALDTTTTINADGTNLLDFVTTLTKRANAYMRGAGTYLDIDHPTDRTPAFTVQGDDIGLLSSREFDAGVANKVRVDGGEARAQDDAQPTQSSYTTVTRSSRASFRVDTRKSQIDRLELWTRPTGSEEAITVRIQKDDGGAPVAPGDSTSDIVSKTLSHEFLADDDYTSFLLPNHTLPEPRPWVIVETDGDTGQDIGTDGTTPTYKSWYRYTVTVQQTDSQSVQEYRKRERRVKAKSVESIEGANAIAAETLNHEATPEHDVNAPAVSERVHALQVGDVITFDFPREQAVGDYIITERSDSFDGATLDTAITAQEVSSV